MDQFVLVNGYIKIDNSKIVIEERNTELKDRGGFIGILFALICISLYHDFQKIETLKSFFFYFNIVLKFIGIITIIYLLFYISFQKKWSKRLIINELTKIVIESSEFEYDVKLVFNNARNREIEFRKLENQFEPFLELLKKRNSRIIIEEIK